MPTPPVAANFHSTLPFNLPLQQMSVTRQLAGRLQELDRLGVPVGMLGPGYPTPELDFMGMWNDAHAYLTGHTNPPAVAGRIMGYTATEGLPSVRNLFAETLGSDLRVAVDPEADMVPTVGITGAIDLLVRMAALASDNGAAVFCSRPAYAGFTTRVQHERGLALMSVRMDDKGMDPNHLEEQIRAARRTGFLPVGIYTIPNGHNPTGVTEPLSRRQEILQVAARQRVAIFEDGAYHFMTFTDPASQPPSLYALDPERVVHLFSFSKLRAPGTRAAFALSKASFERPDGRGGTLRDVLTAMQADAILFHSATSLFLLEAATARAAGSFWNFARPAIEVYRQNRDALLEVLQERLGPYPELFQWNRPEAGFFITLRVKMPGFRADDELMNKAIETHRVVFTPMRGFYPQDAIVENPNAGYDEIRLAYSFTKAVGPGRVEEVRRAGEKLSSFLLKEAGVR